MRVCNLRAMNMWCLVLIGLGGIRVVCRSPKALVEVGGERGGVG